MASSLKLIEVETICFILHRFIHHHDRPIIVNEYELDESYSGSIRSPSRSSIEKETEADDLEFTIYENRLSTESEVGGTSEEENESEKKE